MQNLLVGITLAIIVMGLLIACIPRGGKKAWFVGKPFLEPAAPILMMGLLLVISDLTTIDEIGLSGARAGR